MKLLDLKQFDEFASSRRVKVLRHRSATEDLWQLVREDQFQRYQNLQARDVFGSAEYVISFIAERHNFARFVGVWRVLSKKEKLHGRFMYKTAEYDGFDELKNRLVVHWGDGTRSWAQWLHKAGNKEVSEILPLNYVRDFPGFYDFVLDYHELKTLIENPDPNREWYRMLRSVAGVYVILDKKSGRQYVGSAYGAGGIWARWKAYAKNPSGGNSLISDLLLNKPNAYKNFQFSILRVLEPNATKDDAISQEKLVKKKLGSRAFGLNAN